MIYVLIPAHNEASTVGLLLWKVRQVFTAFAREYQLLVVNDGSTDATDDVLAPYTRALPLTLVTHRHREGYAKSLEELLRLAAGRTDRPRRDLVVTLQADFSDAPDDIPELVKRIEGGADIVVADGRRRDGLPRAEALARRLLTPLLRPALRLDGVTDYVSTLRAYRIATLARLIRERGSRPIVTHDGWAADLELLARASRHARRIESVSVAAAATPRQRPSRATPLRSALRTWRAAYRLGALLRTPAEPPAAHEDEPAPPRRRGRGRGRGRPPVRPAPSPA